MFVHSETPLHCSAMQTQQQGQLVGFKSALLTQARYAIVYIPKYLGHYILLDLV